MKLSKNIIPYVCDPREIAIGKVVLVHFSPPTNFSNR